MASTTLKGSGLQGIAEREAERIEVLCKAHDKYDPDGNAQPPAILRLPIGMGWFRTIPRPNEVTIFGGSSERRNELRTLLGKELSQRKLGDIHIYIGGDGFTGEEQGYLINLCDSNGYR